MEQLRTRIEGGTAFARTLGATLVSLGDGTAEMRLDAPGSLHNHVGGPHAAALFGLGETAAAAVVVSVFHDLVDRGAVPLIKGASIDYRAIATGVVLATAHLAGDGEDGVRASVAERGLATFPVEVVFRREADGQETGSMTAQMALKRFA
jgi:acyl-coenzyme A thioesterase PaaI-like protein